MSFLFDSNTYHHRPGFHLPYLLTTVFTLIFHTTYVLGKVSLPKLKGVSCNLQDSRVFLLGGVYLDNGASNNVNIYISNLDLDFKNGSIHQWDELNPSGYKAPGAYLTSAINPLTNSLYYLGGEVRADNLIVYKFYTNNHTVVTTPGSPDPLRNIRKGTRHGDQEPLFVNSTLRYMHDGFFTLIDGTLQSHESPRKEMAFLGSNFDSNLDQFVDFDLRQFPNSSRFTFSFSSMPLNRIYKPVAVHNDIVYIVDPTTRRVITYDINRRLRSFRRTTGDRPREKIVYSTFQEDHLLYLVGSLNNSHDTVYVLDTIKLEWSSHKVAGFSGAPEGCLISYKDKLYHVSGANNSKDMQIIDKISWALISFDSGDQVNVITEVEPDSESVVTAPKDNRIDWRITVYILCSVVLLFLTVQAFLLLRKKRELQPPKFIYNFKSNPVALSTSIRTNRSVFYINELQVSECFERPVSSETTLYRPPTDSDVDSNPKPPPS